MIDRVVTILALLGFILATFLLFSGAVQGAIIGGM